MLDIQLTDVVSKRIAENTQDWPYDVKSAFNSLHWQLVFVEEYQNRLLVLNEIKHDQPRPRD